MPVQFDVMSEAYDAMVNWPKRLANETPFYRWVFEQASARSVLDAACGTGRHAAMFASWGLQVEGADISPEMTQWCREQYPQAAGLRWVTRSFTQAAAEPSDVALCMGNSLPLVEDLATAAQALGAMAASASHALVIHAVNLYARPDGPTAWDKCRRLRLSLGDCIINKGIHRCGDYGYVDFVLTPLESPEPQAQTRCVRFLGIRAPWLLGALRQHGFARVELFGNYQRHPFDEAHSNDLIAVAFRR